MPSDAVTIALIGALGLIASEWIKSLRERRDERRETHQTLDDKDETIRAWMGRAVSEHARAERLQRALDDCQRRLHGRGQRSRIARRARRPFR